MIIILLDKKVRLKWSHRTKSYYENFGYKFTKINDEFKVYITDLSQGSHIKINLKCDYCGNSYETSYKNYIKTQNKNSLNAKDSCYVCKSKKIEENSLLKYGNKSRKFNFNSIQNTFKKNNLILLETNYIDARTKMRCQCVIHTGEVLELSYNDVQQGSRCKYCSWAKLNEDRKFSYDYVKSLFEKRDFLLLEKDYKNIKTKMEFICNKHPQYKQKTSLDNVLIGGGCKYCRYKKISGENNWRWNGGVSHLNVYLREKLVDWKKQTMSKCNYKCVITGKRFDVIHHLYGFNQILKESFEITNVPMYETVNEYTESELSQITAKIIELHNYYGLGVCLTKEAHDEFHKVYGYGNNTPKQFEEFKLNYKRQVI